MGLILDSTVVIAAERAGQTAYRMVESLGASDLELAVSVVTVLEMAHGVVRANSEKRKAIRQCFLNDLLSGMPVHPVTIPATHNARHFEKIPGLTIKPL